MQRMRVRTDWPVVFHLDPLPEMILVWNERAVVSTLLWFWDQMCVVLGFFCKSISENSHGKVINDKHFDVVLREFLYFWRTKWDLQCRNHCVVMRKTWRWGCLTLLRQLCALLHVPAWHRGLKFLHSGCHTSLSGGMQLTGGRDHWV